MHFFTYMYFKKIKNYCLSTRIKWTLIFLYFLNKKHVWLVEIKKIVF